MEQLSVSFFESIFRQRSEDYVRKYRDQNGNLKFHQLSINEPLFINYDLQYKILFEECVFEKPLVFKSRIRTSFSITFRKCIFKDEVKFEGGEFSIVHFDDCSILTAQLNFMGGDFAKELRIERGNLSYVGFYGGKFNEVIIGAYRYETFIDQVFINCNKISGYFSFYKVIGLEFDLRGNLSSDSILHISDCIFKHFIIAEFSNNGKLRLNRISYNNTNVAVENPEEFKRLVNKIIFDNQPRFSTFYIQNSVLDNVEMFSVDFRSFGVVSIRESSLNNIIVSNVVWPKKIFHFPLIARNDNSLPFKKLPLISEDYMLIKENYRQLKYSLSKQGDTIGEGYFHGLEMRTYNKLLTWKDDFGTKLILKFSYWTSNYGQSISLPLIYLLEGHLILFLIGLLFNGYTPLHISISNPTWAGFKEAFEKYFIYINPLRKTETSLSGYLIFLDLIMRIWSSYMIYNIIRASRRFIK